jgi:hypothetical protein
MLRKRMKIDTNRASPWMKPQGENTGKREEQTIDPSKKVA